MAGERDPLLFGGVARGVGLDRGTIAAHGDALPRKRQKERNRDIERKSTRERER